MQPLKITFELMKAVHVPEYKVNLDGLLAFACVQEYVTEDSGISIEDAHDMLPLAKAESDGMWVWQSSDINLAEGEHSSITIQRTFDLYATVLDNGERYKAVRREDWSGTISSSPHKAYLFKEPMRHSPFATAYCVGDKEKIEYLLNKHITHLGKYSRIDAGRIRQISVEEDQSALVKWQERIMPWLPDGVDKSHYAKVFETTSPPYWKRENRQVAFRFKH